MLALPFEEYIILDKAHRFYNKFENIAKIKAYFWFADLNQNLAVLFLA